MTRPVLLNNIDHKHLRVMTGRSEALGDAVMCALTHPDEFAAVQAHYPIVFSKSAQDGRFQPFALFGFEEGQNLFLDTQGWDATYLPHAIERLPFLIGTAGDELTVHVDLDSSRLSETQGEPIFLPHGGHTEYLERMSSLLLALHEGIKRTPGFIDALLRHELLESFVLDVTLDSGSQHRLAGFYTINEDKLASLAADALGELHRQGHLRAIFMAVASLGNFRLLIERFNRRESNRA